MPAKTFHVKQFGIKMQKSVKEDEKGTQRNRKAQKKAWADKNRKHK
jgi:hypothetical protein